MILITYVLELDRAANAEIFGAARLEGFSTSSIIGAFARPARTHVTLNLVFWPGGRALWVRDFFSIAANGFYCDTKGALEGCLSPGLPFNCSLTPALLTNLY